MSGVQQNDRVLRDDTYLSQIDVRKALTCTEIYPKANGRTYPNSGSVSVKAAAPIVGADSLYIITLGNNPALSLTLKFKLRGYQYGSDVTVSVPAQTDGKMHVTEVSYSDLSLVTDVDVESASFTGGDFIVCLGKLGLG